MEFSFADADIERIATTLGVPAKQDGHTIRFELNDEASGRRITLEVIAHLSFPPDLLGDQPTNLVSVYAASSFLQLQGCTGFITSQELGEVIFFGRRGDMLSGLVVEREAGCSLYANVDKSLLSTDFTQLPPEMIMSSVALSMAETLFDDLG